MTAKHLLGQFAVVVTVALLFLAQPSAAQGSKWWQSDQYKRELGLTVEQSKRLEDIFQAAIPKLKADKKALDLAEAEFEKLLERGDDGSVMDQVERVEAARAELNKDHTLMMLKMKKVLTADQWAKFTALHQAAERERTRSNGRGGSGTK
jgi:Spy/CpxP family protein refolding chaperone